MLPDGQSHSVSCFGSFCRRRRRHHVPSRIRQRRSQPGCFSGLLMTGPDEFKTKVIGALRRLQKMPHIIRAFFADPANYETVTDQGGLDEAAGAMA